MSDLSCERVTLLLGDYVEDVLPPDERRALEAHFVVCKRCGDLLVDYVRLPGLVRRATDVAMPPGAQARLRRQVARTWRSRS